MPAQVLSIAGLTLPRPPRPAGRPPAHPRAARSLVLPHRDGGCTQYRFDENGHLAERADASGSTFRYRYDAAGRLAAAIQHDGSETAFHFDDAGRLRARLDASGLEHRFVYDELGRMTEARFGPDRFLRADYDVAGRLVGLDEPEIALRIERAESGALVAFERTIGGLRFRIRTDARGEALALALPDGKEIDLTELPDLPAFDSLPPRLDERGNATLWLDPESGTEIEARYDACDRLLEFRGKNTEIRYAYDLAGNRCRREDEQGATLYSYDHRHRLRATRGPAGELHFSWDGVGRLIERRATGTHCESRTGYVWDAAGRLVEVLHDDVAVVRFLSDFEGRTVRRVRPDTPEAPGAEQIFIRDLGGRLLAVTDGTGRLLAAFPPQAAGRAAIVPGLGPLRLELDHLGSTRAIRDRRGEILWRGQYSPFGRLLGPAPDFPCPLFGGYLAVPELGLWDAGARFYDPALGLFLSPDPWTGGPDDARLLAAGGAALPPAWLTRPLEAHPYTFCRNNPLSFRDPEGLSGWGIFGKVLLSIFWGSVWTLLGLSLTILDWIVQFVLFGWAYLPKYGIDGVSSGRLGTAAMINVGGLGPSPLVLSNVLFARRGLVDELDDTRLEYIVPAEATRVPRALRTAKTAYFEHLLAHTVQALYSGPFWPFVYLFGSDWAEKDATRESGFPTEAFPVAALTPEKILTSRGSILIVVGGSKPYTATLSAAAAGAIGPIQDNPRFGEALLTPLYAPGDYTITVRDNAGFSDTRSFEIADLRVSDIQLVRPQGLRLYDDISEPEIPTIRLIDSPLSVARAQATLDLEVKPKGGELFFESDPANPAPLVIVPTSQIGNGRIFVTLGAAPAGPAPADHLLNIRAWNQQGRVLKKLRFRALTPMTIVLQAYIVRNTDGSRPAAEVARLQRAIQRTNEVWSQTGIQFRWRADAAGRPQVSFIDDDNLLLLNWVNADLGVGPTPGSELEQLLRWRPTPPGPLAAGTHSSADPAAIHVYWLDGLSPPGLGEDSDIHAFASPFLRQPDKYVVMTRRAIDNDLGHEIGHTLNLPHPDQRPPVPDRAEIRLMYSQSDSGRDFIANTEPNRARPSGDETAEARSKAPTFAGP